MQLITPNFTTHRRAGFSLFAYNGSALAIVPLQTKIKNKKICKGILSNAVLSEVDFMIIKENGKTFEGSEPEFTRIPDEKYCGKRTRYTRCSICGKLVSRQWRGHHRYVHIEEDNANRHKINF